MLFWQNIGTDIVVTFKVLSAQLCPQLSSKAKIMLCMKNQGFHFEIDRNRQQSSFTDTTIMLKFIE